MIDRRYRGQRSRPVPIWNGIFEHCESIGAAVWEFLWCVDALTEEREGVGLVHGGAPVKVERIADDLNRDRETVRRHLGKLVDGKYIRARRTPYGFVIEVPKSKKFGIWRTWGKEKPQNAVSLAEKPQIAVERNCELQAQKPQFAVSKEDTPAVSTTKGEQPAAALKLKPEDSVWGFLEIQPCGPGSFRSLLENGWAHRNGGPYSILIGDALDAWETTEGRKPKGCAPLFRRLSKLREHEKKTPEPGAVASEPIHVFTREEIPA